MKNAITCMILISLLNTHSFAQSYKDFADEDLTDYSWSESENRTGQKVAAILYGAGILAVSTCFAATLAGTKLCKPWKWKTKPKPKTKSKPNSSYKKVGKKNGQNIYHTKAPSFNQTKYENLMDEGMKAIESGDFLNADKKLSQVLKQFGDDPLVLNNRGIARIHLNRLDDAERDFKKASDLAPNLDEPYLNLSSLRIVQSKFDEAITLANKVIDRDPQNWRALGNRGIAKVAFEDFGDALSDLDRAMKKFDGALEAKYEIYFYRGRAHLGLGNTGQAISDFRWVSYSNVIDIDAEYMLAKAYLSNNQFSLAKKHIQNSIAKAKSAGRTDDLENLQEALEFVNKYAM